jgi:flavodoxin
MKRMLVLYYSWSNGNTKGIAERLAKAASAEIERIETEVPYPEDYNTTVDQGQKEVEAGYCPKIKQLNHQPEDYDVIAVGTPTWWYTMAPAVKTIFSQHDWNGKTVIPFFTNGGWPGHVIKDMEKAAKGADFEKEMEIRFDSEGGSRMITKDTEVQKWIDSIVEELKK